MHLDVNDVTCENLNMEKFLLVITKLFELTYNDNDMENKTYRHQHVSREMLVFV